MRGGTTSSTYTATSQANTFTTSGLLGGDSVTGVSGLGAGTQVGSYADTLGNATGTGLGNYTISYVNGSLRVTPAVLTITGATTSSTYTATSQVNTFTTSGLLGGDSVIGVSGQGRGTNAGTYADTLADATGTGPGNYTISYVNGSLRITPATLTITAGDAQRLVNAPNPPLTAIYAGFVGGETPANLKGTLSFSTSATVASPPGAYSVTPSGQTSSNYAIRYVDGVLRVTRSSVEPGALPGGYSPQAPGSHLHRRAGRGASVA
ncbi:MBG-2 domain-containing protein [Pseudoxanthomonas sp. NC8]|nr:MBG-2 domain-containing protein [Pseudoxanthomonas sp. NC8]